MKICEIWIRGFQQFQDIHLDFTNPETGEPVSKVCFIGGNGTGKTTLLRFLNIVIQSENANHYVSQPYSYALKIIYEDGFQMIYANIRKRPFFLKSDISKNKQWFDELILLEKEKDDKLKKNILEESHVFYNKYSLDYENEKAYYSRNPFYISSVNHRIINNYKWQLIHAPSETENNSYLFNDLPNTNLNEALKLNQKFPLHHEVSNSTVADFWKTLIFHIRKREEERSIFENLPENLDKSKRELIEEFDNTHLKIEEGLAGIWNKILNKAGLELDIENIRKPIQLTDNLHAFIKIKATGEHIQYHQLSTGIRNFIFRIGHIYSLYFNREIKSGFLLVDEPENSLFPDFLFDLMETYDEIVKDKNGENNTQMFFATHNPIVAAQFEPYERVILEWDEAGSVVAYKGKSPVGDDPNDLLINDFGLSNLMGQKGQDVWDEYLSLKKKLRRTKDAEEKKNLLHQINQIGEKYNFES